MSCKVALGLTVLILAAAGMISGQAPATRTAAMKLPFTISAETTVVTTPLRADGTPDFVAALNERYSKGVTPQNNGFVVWIKIVGVANINVGGEILKMCGAEEPAPGAEAWVPYSQYLTQMHVPQQMANGPADDEYTQAQQVPWVETEHPIVQAYLKDREKELALAAEAVNRPRWWSPYVGKDMIRVLFPGLGVSRDVANALIARAMLRAKAGDMDGFMADVDTSRKLARGIGGGASVIERLVGVAIETKAIGAIASVAGSETLTQGQCAALRKALSGLAAMPAMSETIDISERWQELDIIMTLARSRGGLLSTDEIWENLGDSSLKTMEAVLVDWDVVLKMVNHHFDDLVKAMNQPLFEEMKQSTAQIDREMETWGKEKEAHNKGMLWQDAGETKEAYSTRIAKAIMVAVSASLDKAGELQRRTEFQKQMTEVVLAAAEFKAKTGNWPGMLKDLTPGYLADIPKDMYSEGGYDLRWEVNARGARVFSAGPNGKYDFAVGAKAE